MIPFYFGTSPKRLFGIYHTPDGTKPRDHGVALCHPFGREHILAQRTFRQLAALLTRAGFHVLRFDYYGCGDSSGESDEGSVAQWTDDVVAAVDETRDYAGVRHVSLIGLRLGATLAALAGATRSKLRSIVLWEPALRGREYVEELVVLHDEWLEGEGERPVRNNSELSGGEVLGFPLTPSMRQQLAPVDLAALPGPPAERILVVEQQAGMRSRRLLDSLNRFGVGAEHRCILESRFWRKGELASSQVPLGVVQSIVSWMSETEP